MLPQPVFYFEIHLLDGACLHLRQQAKPTERCNYFIRLITQRSNFFGWWLIFIYITFLNYFTRPLCLRLLLFTSLPLNDLFC